MPQPDQEYNVWRDTLVRYIGYADEFGEALEPYIGHKAVKASYGVAAAYAAGDLLTTSAKTYRRNEHLPPLQRFLRVLMEIGDGTLFHTIATVFGPALMVKFVRQRAYEFLMRPELSKVLTRMATPLSTMAGLALIPFISHPVDAATNTFLDWTYRPLVGKNRIVGNLKSVPADDIAPQHMGFVLPSKIQPESPELPFEPANGRPISIHEPKTFKILFG